MIERRHSDIGQDSHAIFSDCEKYRYWLSRTWDTEAPSITYLMLNPSTANEMVNDPTIERCQRRAINAGYGRMVIVNLFPIRMTDSKLLVTVKDVLLGDPQVALDFVLKAVEESAITVCGWGEHKLAGEHAKYLMSEIDGRNLSGRLMCLKKNKDGSPQHPLYLSYALQPIPFEV